MKLKQRLMACVAGWCCLLGLSVQANARDAIVDVAWLAAHLEREDVLLIDARPSAAFEALHVRGAVSLPWEKLFDEQLMMPGLQELQALFSGVGVDHDKTVVVMDDGEFIWAARLYWLLETLGHQDVRLLNAGFGAWPEASLPLTQEAVEPVPSQFVPTLDRSRLQTKLGTLVSIGQRRIVDGRPEPHYLGQKSSAARFGHIPTAEHYPCTQNYEVTEAGNVMRTLEALADVYSALPKDEEIILYCGGGAESALNYVVMQALGYRVSIYDGSWQEWGNDPVVPIHNPAQGDDPATELPQ